MNIFIDNRVHPSTGMGRYVESLYNKLVEHSALFNFILYNTASFVKFKNQNISKIFELIYDDFFLNSDLIKHKCDLFHCTKNFGVPGFFKGPVITTIHDLIPLVLTDYYVNYQFNLYNYYRYKTSINTSRSIIGVSKYSCEEIRKFFPSAKDKLYYVPQGCDILSHSHVSTEESFDVMKSLGVENNYILAIGGTEPRKNVAMLVTIFDEHPSLIPCDLVVIGGDWRGYKMPRPKKRPFAFHRLVNLSNRELVSAYTAATVFVFPSIYEGFGLPVLEAMACGTPVLAHNGTSIPEVAGDAAMLVDMHNADECLRALSRLLTNRSLREEYIAAGRERVKMFSWEKTAAQTLEVYKSVL